MVHVDEGGVEGCEFADDSKDEESYVELVSVALKCYFHKFIKISWINVLC